MMNCHSLIIGVMRQRTGIPVSIAISRDLIVKLDTLAKIGILICNTYRNMVKLNTLYRLSSKKRVLDPSEPNACDVPVFGFLTVHVHSPDPTATNSVRLRHLARVVILIETVIGV